MAAPVMLGLIGVGRWGRNVVRSLGGLADIAVLTAVASRNPDTAGLAPPDCRIFADWRDMLVAGGLDGVVIAAPPALHAEMTLAAIAAGIPVLVEKPLTMDPAEARAIQAAARAANVPVQVDHIHLYSAAFRRLRTLLPEIGPLRAIRSQAGNRGPYRGEVSVLWDWGPHDAAMAMAVTGRPPIAVTATRLARDGLAENVEMVLDFGDGLTACAVLGTLMDRTRRFEVEGEGGTLIYDDLAEVKLLKSGQPVMVSGEPPLAQALRDFCAVATGRAKPDGGLELGVWVVDVLAQAARRIRR